MATIPTHHEVGDEGHTSDHNLISDALTEHEQRITTAQTDLDALEAAALVKTGANVISVANPSGVAETVVIPAGTREVGIWLKSVTYGGVRTFGLDTYGQARLGAATPSEVPLSVWGYNNSQTGDLVRFRKYEAGPLLARVDANGNVYAPNITPTPWTNLTLNAGLVWNSALGTRPQYRMIGDMVQLRGNLQKSNGADFTSSPQDIATLPVGFRPPALFYSVQASAFRQSFGYSRTEILTTGLIRTYFWASTYNPDWHTLDGITFSVTP